MRLPNSGVRRSVTKHNSDIGAVADWVALSAADNGPEPVTKSDVLDVLVEQQIYESQDFCNEYLADVWREVRRRHAFGDGLVHVEGNRLEVLEVWSNKAELLIPVLLTLGPRYEGWFDEFGDYIEQGRLFERLVLELINHIFDEWEVLDCGWSGAGEPLILAETVSSLGSRLRCITREDEIAKWAGSSAKDAGVDFALFHEFSDGRGAYPAFLGQVASGADWVAKLKEPDLAVWLKLLSFVSQPQRAVVIPEVLDGDDFDRRANQVEGLLVDRLRLFHNFSPGAVSSELRAELVAWVEPRFEWLAA